MDGWCSWLWGVVAPDTKWYTCNWNLCRILALRLLKADHAVMGWWGDDCRSLGKHLGYALMLSNFLVSEHGPWQTKTWISIYIYMSFFLWVLLRAHLVGWETGQGGWVEIQGFRKNKFPKMLDSFTSLTLPRRCAGWIQSKSFFTYLTWGVSPQKSIIFPQQL